MKILGIIPARGGSKRVVNKNRRILAGKPLLMHVIDKAVELDELEDLVFTTEDEELKRIVQSNSSIYIIDRPIEFSRDTSKAIEYVEHALHHMNQKFGKTYDAIMIMQPTTPLTEIDDFRALIKLFLSNDCDSAVTVSMLDQVTHPKKIKVLEGIQLKKWIIAEEEVENFSELTKLYARNGAGYISSIEIIKTGKLLGPMCIAHVMPPERSIDINYKIDLDFAQFLLEKKLVEENE